MTQRLAERQRPASSPVGKQRWNHLLFTHWRVAPSAVQATLPPGLMVDTHEGAAFVGVVPFFMERIRPQWLPPIPWVSWFLELNVRTYVHDRDGRPGVWFYSLDCNQPLAVAIGRRFFHLPYFHAQMSARHTQDRIEYRSRRRGDAAESGFAWREIGDETETHPGSLEFFLVERYLLFTVGGDGALCSGRVHHRPYRVRSAELNSYSTRPAALAGFEVSDPPVSVLSASAVDVSVHAVERLSAAAQPLPPRD